MREIEDLSKKINFNNLTYHYNVKNDPKNVIGFKGPLCFYRTIQEGNIALENTEEQQKEFKSELNERVKGIKK